jgi:hypothetical protein
VTTDRLITRGEACRIIGCQAHHLDYLARRGTIARTRVGGGPLLPRFGYSATDVERIARQLDRFGKLTCARGPAAPGGAR